MATIFRGPTFAGNHRKPPPAQTWVGPNLLVTTLAVVAALPFNNASAFSAPQHPSHALSANPDTSRGTPKTLYADAAKAFFVPASFAPDQHGRNEFLNPDTSKGTAKVLYADSVSPFSNKPHTAPDRPRPVADTTQDTPLTLLSLQVTNPVVNAAHFPPQAWKWWNLDTSKGVAKVLYQDSVAPFFNPAQPVLDRLRPVADTTQDTPLTLLTQPAPFVPPASLRVDFSRDLRDTSQSTPLALFPAGAPPFVSPLSIQVDRRLDIRLDVPANLAIQTPGIQPFAQYNWPNAIEYRQQFEPKWDAQAYPGSIPDAIPDQPTAGGVGEEYGKKKKRFVRKIGNRLVSFSNAADALNFDARPDEVEPEAVVEVKTIKAKAKALERPDVAVLLKQEDYTAVLEAYEAMLDEEDIEMLLLSL